MRFHGRRVLSRVWLKTFDFRHCRCWYSARALLNPVVVRLVKDRKLRVPRIGSLRLRETPDELIKGRSHAVKEVAHDKGEFFGNVFDLKPEDVPLIPKVVFAFNRYRVVLAESPKAFPEVVKVLFGPSGFQEGISCAPHDLPQMCMVGA